MRRNLIGLSLSLCMRDILQYDIDPRQIIIIVSATAFKTAEEVLENYYDGYWSNTPKAIVKDKLFGIWSQVSQPRLQVKDFRGHSVSKGHWLNTDTGNVSNDSLR